MTQGWASPATWTEIADALAGATLASVLITHAHLDHASGVPAIVARWPSVKVLQYPDIGAGPIRAGDTELRPIHTPGHAPDHMCFFDIVSRDVYCGDLVRVGGTIVIPASRGGNSGSTWIRCGRCGAWRRTGCSPGTVKSSMSPHR